MKKLNKIIKKGFTLVELVVVIAVIAILAAVSVGAYFGVTESASNSRLTQEGAQIKLNITLLGSEGNDYCSLNNEYLIINDLGEFSAELNNNSGINYNVLIDGDGSFDEEHPTINFITVNVDEGRYDYFEYANPDVVDKYIKVHIVSGDSEIVDGEIGVNTPSTTDEVIDNYTGDETGIVFTFGENKDISNNEKGTLIESETYNITPESINTNYWDIELYNIKNVWKDAYSGRDKSILIGRPIANEQDLGHFSFDVKNEVKAVIISIASYGNSYFSELNINGTTIEKAHNDSTKRQVKITTNNTKTITISTTEENKYCFIREMIFVI